MVTILSEVRGSVAVLTINRPEVLNAIDTVTMRELGRAIRAAIGAPEVRVLILTGSGERAFSTGGDVREMAGWTALEADAGLVAWEETHELIERSPKPVIAAVNGIAYGGGTELALACHIRLASDDAAFGQPEIRLAHIPGAGGTQRLPRTIGLARAYEYLLTGDPIPAADAYRLGLVNHVYPKPDLLPRAVELAERIARLSPVAVAMTLQTVRLGWEAPLATALRLERALGSLTLLTPESQQGLEAFLSMRRSPAEPGEPPRVEP
jgi:enoyl-CoA hydratase